MVNGVESVLLRANKGNIVEYEKLFFGAGVIKNAAKFYFTENDTKALANYFMRTYRKAIFEPNEANIARLVSGILHGPENSDPSLDSFKTYLLFDGVIILDFLKVFLLYAQTEAEYERIARVVIEREMGAMVAKLNSPEHNDLITAITASVQLVKNDQVALSAIRTKLDEKYASALKLCWNKLQITVALQSDGSEDAEEQDYFENLMSNEKNASDNLIHQEQENFKKIVLPETPVHTTVEVVSVTKNLPVNQDLEKEDKFAERIMSSEIKKLLSEVGPTEKFVPPVEELGNSEKQTVQSPTTKIGSELANKYGEKANKLITRSMMKKNIKTTLETGETGLNSQGNQSETPIVKEQTAQKIDGNRIFRLV